MPWPDWLTLPESAHRKIWDAVLSLFERHPIRIVLAGVLLVSAIVAGQFYVDRTKQYQDIVSTTVRAETEDTPQRFKVLEAFIMSTIDSGLSARIQQATISSEFSRHLNDLHRVLSEPGSNSAVGGGAVGAHVSIPDYVTDIRALPSQNAILTDNASDGFLFFPLNLLRTRWDTNYEQIFKESRAPTDGSPTLAAAVTQDSAIADDIAITRRLLPTMKEFTHVSLFEPDESLKQLSVKLRPVQIYYITKNGLNRIINDTDANEQKVVYRNMFRSTTFFPSRPYFIEAFRRIPPSHLDNVTGITQNAFYVSQPYLDIAGSGVVVTLARPVRYNDHSDAAICFDLRVSLDNDIIFKLKQRLEDFGSTPQDVTCSIGFRSGDIDCQSREGANANVGFPLKLTLEERLNATMRSGDLSTVVGNISILDGQTSQPDLSRASMLDFFTYPVELIFGHNTRPITFAIPLRSPRPVSEGKGLEAKFLIASLNLERFQEITSLFGLASVSLLASAFFVMLFSWQGEMRTRRSYEEAFKTVDKVLYGAPTPYCRLDSDDAIVDCNTAFCDLLKMSADEASVRALKGQTFESLVAQRSKTTYHRVQERRRAGKEVQPYTLYFVRKDNTEVETRVESGVIPGRSRRELPETFGIVIK